VSLSTIFALTLKAKNKYEINYHTTIDQVLYCSVYRKKIM